MAASNDQLTGTTLIIGGARSGKTRRALALAECAPRRTMIATAEAWDDEMAARIAAHQAERGDGWETIEAPLDLAAAIGSVRFVSGAQHAVVIDCLTLWLSNLMHHERDLSAATTALVAALDTAPAPVICVSNEVGLGIVPENALARRFRDAQGRLNQDIAAVAQRVEFVAAGLSLRMK